MDLTKTDMVAIEAGDSSYINNKGADLYTEGKYDLAIEYYRIAASMGDEHSISNLGYCYLYGRSIEKNPSLAIAYFKLAAKKDDIDALYKLGDIYKRGLGVEKDKSLALYYFEKALNAFHKNNYASFEYYPSLFLSMAQEYMPNGNYKLDLRRACDYLHMAIEGYEFQIGQGSTFYAEALKMAQSLYADPMFDEIKHAKFCDFHDDCTE